LYYDKLPVSPAYAEEDHSGYEYLLRPRKPLCMPSEILFNLPLPLPLPTFGLTNITSLCMTSPSTLSGRPLIQTRSAMQVYP
jgi:hypothetical protein